jgi:hypothetical protein
VLARVEATSAAFDTDGDGLIDADEIEVFQTDPNCRDSDGDGLSDGSEVRAGTDPRNRSSVLAIRGISPDPMGGRTVVWSSVPGKCYQVEYKDRLDTPVWLDLGDIVEAAGETCTFVDKSAPPRDLRIYRVRLVE